MLLSLGDIRSDRSSHRIHKLATTPWDKDCHKTQILEQAMKELQLAGLELRVEANHSRGKDQIALTNWRKIKFRVWKRA